MDLEFKIAEVRASLNVLARIVRKEERARRNSVHRPSRRKITTRFSFTSWAPAETHAATRLLERRNGAGYSIPSPSLPRSPDLI